MNRIMVAALRLVVEWDEVTGEAKVGSGHERGWEMVVAIREAVSGASGGFEDHGMVERRSTREGVGVDSCFEALRGAEVVVVWAARFWEAGESRLVAEAVRAALAV